MHVAGPLPQWTPAQRRAAAFNGISAMATIHAIDWRRSHAFLSEAGTSPFDRHLERIAEWYAWATRGERPHSNPRQPNRHDRRKQQRLVRGMIAILGEDSEETPGQLAGLTACPGADWTAVPTWLARPFQAIRLSQAVQVPQFDAGVWAGWGVLLAGLRSSDCHFPIRASWFGFSRFPKWTWSPGGGLKTG
jgi:hypothetical protein